MAQSFGRDLFMAPGPSVIPDRVLNAMHRAAPNIYEGDLLITVDKILDDLRKVAKTKGYPTIYIANGHGVWEAALHNVLSPGDKIVGLVTGTFGNGWAETAADMGIEVDLLDFGTSSSFDVGAIGEYLKNDSKHEIKAVLATHTDTSTSVTNDIAALRKTMDTAGHPALLMVDCIASLGCEPFDMDGWGVDVMVAASQKGLMTPPGIAFTFHNEKATQVSESIPKSSPYWDWTIRTDPEIFYRRFAGTPPTHHLFGLEEALQMMLEEEGLENVFSRHAKQAEAIWAAVDKWSAEGALRCNVPDVNQRSTAVTTIVSDTHDLAALQHWCSDNTGLVLGVGIGFGDYDSERIFRIGHMGHMNPVMLLGALSAIEMGMKALDIPFGKGALEAAGKVLAG